jgi:hypothetical protein
VSDLAKRDTGGALALPDEFIDNYPALAVVGGDGDGEFMELLAANLGTDEDEVGLSLGDFVRVKVPTGGLTFFEVPDPDTGDTVTTKTITGIIVTQAARRSFWPTKEISGTPPTCRSTDLKIGVGAFGAGSLDNPTGSCKTCPMSQRGSMTLIDPTRGDTQASACKEQKLLFLLPQGEMLPWMLTVPPGSLGALRKFMLQQITLRRLDYRQVAVTVGLEKMQGQGTPEYARITFVKAGKLDGPEYAAVRAYGEQLAKLVAEQPDVITAVVEGTDNGVSGSGAASDDPAGEAVEYEAGDVPEDEVDLTGATGGSSKARSSR